MRRSCQSTISCDHDHAPVFMEPLSTMKMSRTEHRPFRVWETIPVALSRQCCGIRDVYRQNWEGCMPALVCCAVCSRANLHARRAGPWDGGWFVQHGAVCVRACPLCVVCLFARTDLLCRESTACVRASARSYAEMGHVAGVCMRCAVRSANSALYAATGKRKYNFSLFVCRCVHGRCAAVR